MNALRRWSFIPRGAARRQFAPCDAATPWPARSRTMRRIERGGAPAPAALTMLTPTQTMGTIALPRTAKRIQKQVIAGRSSLESLVDRTAYVLATVQSLTAIVIFVASQGEGSGVAFFMLIGAFLQWLLLRCVAEHLRLQKKLAGVDYEGKISGPTWASVACCSLCKSVLHTEGRCDMCGATITTDDEETK